MNNIDFINVTNESETIKQMRKWIMEQEIENPLAVTLTMLQKVTPANLNSSSFLHIDRILASTNLSVFLKDLNKAIFKNAANRYDKKIKVIAFLEGNQKTGERLHYHLAIERPNRITFEEFKLIIESCWHRTIWSDKVTEIKEMYDEGWLSYISKVKSKPDYMSCFDALNSSF